MVKDTSSNEIEQIDGKTPPEYCEIAGSNPHKHKLIWKDGDLVGHEPASKTDLHMHEIVHRADGSWYLDKCPDCKEDPEHIHEVVFDEDKDDGQDDSRALKLLKKLGK